MSEERTTATSMFRAARDAGLVIRAGLLGGNLLEKAPEGMRLGAALVVRAAMQLRAEERAEVEIAWDRAQKMAVEPPPVPETFHDAKSVYLAALGATEPRACRHDAPGRRGFASCAVCSGAGTVERVVRRSRYYSEAIQVPCDACRGRGVLPCSVCDGTGESVPASVVRVTDVSVTLDDVFVSRAGGGVRDHLLALDELDPAHARDLMTWTPTAEPDEFAGALAEPYERAMGALRAQGATHALIRAFEVYAVPLLELSRGSKRVIVHRAGGEWEAH